MEFLNCFNNILYTIQNCMFIVQCLSVLLLLYISLYDINYCLYKCEKVMFLIVFPFCEHHYCGLLFESDWNFALSGIWKCIYILILTYICYARKIFGEQTMSRTWGSLSVDLTSAYDVRTGVSTVSSPSYFTDFFNKMFQNLKYHCKK